MTKPTQHSLHCSPDEWMELADMVYAELRRAEKKFPEWPDDLLYGYSILNEECGEAQQACLDVIYHRSTMRKYRKELIQTAAMAIRALVDLKQRGKSK